MLDWRLRIVISSASTMPTLTAVAVFAEQKLHPWLTLPHFSLRKVVSEPNFSGRLAAMVHAAFFGMSNSLSTFSNAEFYNLYSCVRHSCMFAEVLSWFNLISPISACVPACCRLLSRWVGNSARYSSHRYMQVAHSQMCESCSRPQTAQYFSLDFPLQCNKEGWCWGCYSNNNENQCTICRKHQWWQW